MSARALPRVVLSQGDPAGIGPELLLRLAAHPWRERPWRPVAIAERAALEAVAATVPRGFERIEFIDGGDLATIDTLPEEVLPVLDPVRDPRRVTPGHSGAADAHGAMAALDLGIDLVTGGRGDALLTLPVAKGSIARHVRPGFVGHTEYLAERGGLERYGRDYLMAFLAPGLRVALLSTHVPLQTAIAMVRREGVLEALRLLGRHVAGPIAVAGLNPHAGEGGLLGSEDDAEVAPAVAAARSEGLDVHGPESADSLFARARRGEFAWVLALYHDQGLVAVKTAAFGTATNWTLGLPFLRTSVDHGTAFPIAGRGLADDAPLRAVIATTLDLVAERVAVAV